MQKSYKGAMGPPRANRRFSQPVTASSSSSDKSRRGSEMVPNPRSTDNLPAAQNDDKLTAGEAKGARKPQYDDKLTVVEAKGPRKPRGSKDERDGPSFDREHYNPDGSLRTVHRIPNFDEAYAEACKARYIRERRLREQEKELSVKQIFEKCG